MFKRQLEEDEQGNEMMSNLRKMQNNPDVDDKVRREAEKAIKLLIMDHDQNTGSNWKKVHDLMFHQDRRPIQHVVNHFKRLKKYEDGDLMKEMRKRKGKKRHLQIIDVSAGEDKNRMENMIKALGIAKFNSEQKLSNS